MFFKVLQIAQLQILIDNKTANGCQTLQAVHHKPFFIICSIKIKCRNGNAQHERFHEAGLVFFIPDTAQALEIRFKIDLVIFQPG